MSKLPKFRPASPLYGQRDVLAEVAKPAHRNQCLRQRTSETGGSFGKSIAPFGLNDQASAANRTAMTTVQVRRWEQEPTGNATAPRMATAAPQKDCDEVTGRWIKEPWPEITDATFLGMFPAEAWIEFRVKLTIKVVGELECLDCGRLRSSTRVEFGPYTVGFYYRTLAITLFIRGWPKLLLYAVKIHGLLDFVRNNKEIIKFVWDYYGEIIFVVKNSADLICKGVFDPSQLEKYIPTFLCLPENCA